MRWDGMGMRWDRRLRRALLHCTALTPFFLSLARPTNSTGPTQLSHTHNTPSSRLLGSPTLVTLPSQHPCHVPFPTLYFPSLSVGPLCFPLHPSLSTYNILILSTTLITELSPVACIPSMHGCNLDRDPRSINFDQILYTHWLFSRPPLQFIPLLYLCARNRHFTPYPLPVIFAS